MSKITCQDSWQQLKCHTAARIALGRSGVSLPTAEVLNFGVAHAAARDAVHLKFEAQTLADRLREYGFIPAIVQSQAGERATYLRRPDLGRCLDPASRQQLLARDFPASEIVFMVADGLSARAVHQNAEPLLLQARPMLEKAGFTLGPVVLAHQARVALGDEVGACLAAPLIVVLIGERPGLSSPDSLGLYLTWQPRPGRSDAERNCISNIRPAGLSYELAAQKLTWLAQQARQLGLSGVHLKDESDQLVIAADPIQPGLAR
jgi:ethanolamine ammonia-lyase small subunit